MLYEFHRKQNSKKPGSVHATYLISGSKRSTAPTSTQSQDNDGEDSTMRSSPPLPSSSFQRPDEQEDSKPIHAVTLVREEHLEEAKAQFESISGMHIYSLQVNGVSDVQVLTDCNRRVATEYIREDPLKEWKQYGIVQNADVRRRTTKGQPPPPPPPAAKKAVAAPATKPAAVEKQAEAKPAAAKSAPPQKSTASAPSKASAGKNQNSSLFKSFAKGSAAAKKKAESQDSSAAPSPAAEPEDVPMTGFSDDDEDDANASLPAELEEVKAPTGESKNERKSKLEAMMDQEDEEMDDAAATPLSVESPHDEGAIDVAEQKEEPKESVVVENGRRRGRRRIMKKKTVKDEDGYLGEFFLQEGFETSTNDIQSRAKKPPGNPSPRKNPRPKRQRCPPQPAVNPPRRKEQEEEQVVLLQENQAKATSCLSSPRNNLAKDIYLSNSSTIPPNTPDSIRQRDNPPIRRVHVFRILPLIEMLPADIFPTSSVVVI